MTTVTEPSLALYRTRHRIQVVDSGKRKDHLRCAVDGVRVNAVKGGWRHDVAELGNLMDADYGQRWPDRSLSVKDAAAVLVAMDILREGDCE